MKEVSKIMFMAIICIAAIVFLSFMLGWMFCHSYQDRLWRDECIQKGVGEYFIDENDERKFRIIPKSR